MVRRNGRRYRKHCQWDKTQRKINFLETVVEDRTEAKRVEEIGVDTAVSRRISTIDL